MYLDKCIVLVICAVIVSGRGQKQNRPKGCTLDSGEKIKLGQQVDVPGKCRLHKCIGNGEWTTGPCGYLGVPAGWGSTTEDTSNTAKYPECCAHLIPPLDIVPDVLDSQPGTEYMTINYGPGVTVDVGTTLTPTQVKGEPEVNYTFWADPKSYYLLAMVDPDAPSRQNPQNREFLHWLVANIPGDNIKSGETIVEYVGAGPPQGTGLHRYFFLLYKQPGRININQQRINKNSVGWRPKFSIKKFAKNYRLGRPESVNVFQAMYDSYVPEIQKQLSGTSSPSGNVLGQQNYGNNPWGASSQQPGQNPNPQQPGLGPWVQTQQPGQQTGFNQQPQQPNVNWQQTERPSYPNQPGQQFGPNNYQQPQQPNYSNQPSGPNNYQQPQNGYNSQPSATSSGNYWFEKRKQQQVSLLSVCLTAHSVSGDCMVDDHVVKVGEKVDVPGKCVYRACAGTDQWIMKACASIGLAPGWIVTPEDVSKTYPECCGRAAPLLNIIPDVVTGLRWSLALKLTYANNIVDYGNELTPTQVKLPPVVDYWADRDSWFLLSMVDPDASTQFLHWLVGNIPGNDVASGDNLAEYVGSGPPKGTGLHRYVFLLYKQSGNITFDEPLLDTSYRGRRNFSVEKFSRKYNLSDPISLNFFVAQYDDYVPEVLKQLGITSVD
ncbi:uncharacterized protein LOC129002333 [Macrosteles quadrilineatus]|uniref:uncharacterized protein LOC129002333 n=1 Tax=Macrosteles quadrilineatus TaxID=74068 RepID=UPI0023E1937A|nr:uncharacterized protein LOC129002333 [Macrosteles quadrilineatus]